jgi:hypothetical protein
MENSVEVPQKLKLELPLLRMYQKECKSDVSLERRVGTSQIEDCAGLSVTRGWGLREVFKEEDGAQ